MRAAGAHVRGAPPNFEGAGKTMHGAPFQRAAAASSCVTRCASFRRALVRDSCGRERIPASTLALGGLELAGMRWWLLLVGASLLGSGAWLLFANGGEASAAAQPSATPQPKLAATSDAHGKPLKIEVEAAQKSIPVGATHEWLVSVTGADGAPMPGCQVRFDGSMPEHGHGLPTAPRVT